MDVTQNWGCSFAPLQVLVDFSGAIAREFTHHGHSHIHVDSVMIDWNHVVDEGFAKQGYNTFHG